MGGQVGPCAQQAEHCSLLFSPSSTIHARSVRVLSPARHVAGTTAEVRDTVEAAQVVQSHFLSFHNERAVLVPWETLLISQV